MHGGVLVSLGNAHAGVLQRIFGDSEGIQYLPDSFEAQWK